MLEVECRNMAVSAEVLSFSVKEREGCDFIPEFRETLDETLSFFRPLSPMLLCMLLLMANECCFQVQGC